MPPFWDPGAALKDAYNFLHEAQVQFLSTSIDFTTLGAAQWALGNMAGLAPYIAFLVALFMIPGAIIVRKLRLSGFMAVVVVMLGPALVTGWMLFVGALRDIGANLTVIGGSIDGSGVENPEPLTLPGVSMVNPIVDVIVFAALIIFTVFFILAFLQMDIINVFIILFGLVLLFLYGLGPRTRRLFSILLAIGLTTLVFGRPVVIFILKLGNIAANAIPDEVAGLSGFIIWSSMGVAALALVALPFGLYKPVHSVLGGLNVKVGNIVRSSIEGKHKSSVSGNVKATVTNRSQSTNNARYARSMKTETRRFAGNRTSDALLALARKGAVAGSNFHPAAKAAVVAGAVVARGVGNAPPRLPKDTTRSSLNDYR